MSIQLRSEEGQQGYIDALHGLARPARRRQGEGDTLAAFVDFLEKTASLIGPPSWEGETLSE